MRVVLDGNRVKSEADLHRELAALLKFPPYYGRNLDALWDCLSAMVERPVHLQWEASGVSRAAMGSETFEQVERILRRTVEQDVAFAWADRFTYELR